MFVSFCLHYAQVPEVPQQASCIAWISARAAREMYEDAKTHDPQSGDIVFFDENADGYADRMGLVEKIQEDGSLITIEGNRANAVTRGEYTKQDSSLLGYGIVPVGELHEISSPENTYTPVTEQTIQAVIYTDETLQQRSEDETLIRITGMLPADATARAYPVTLADGTLEGQSVLLAYDITIVDRNGVPVESTDGEKPFVVSIRPPGWTPSEDENYNVFYIPDEGAPKRITTTREETEVSFETNHFSTYALTANGNNSTVYLNGSSGNDSNSGTSANAAVKTLDTALLLV
jgi:hypothetical protein